MEKTALDEIQAIVHHGRAGLWAEPVARVIPPSDETCKPTAMSPRAAQDQIMAFSPARQA